ncbi:MAG: MFS transporter, partial [Pseudomonadota bacterium]
HRLASDDDTASGLIALYFLMGVLAAPAWSWATKRASKHRIWCWAMLYACVVFAAVPFLGAGDVVAFAVVCVLTGIAFGADIVLPPAIQADVVDIDTAQTGEQRTGLYFAIWSVVTKAAQGILGGIGLLVLSQLGFDPNGSNSETVLWGLTALYAGVPIVLKLAAVALTWNFDLDADTQADLRSRIENRAGTV